jgi:hypothetical protein
MHKRLPLSIFLLCALFSYTYPQATCTWSLSGNTLAVAVGNITGQNEATARYLQPNGYGGLNGSQKLGIPHNTNWFTSPSDTVLSSSQYHQNLDIVSMWIQ